MAKQRERVLIVDDDPEVRDLLMDQIFNANQFEVFEASDGIQGLEMVSKRQPDLIYLDLVMPSLTGKDMLVGLKSRQYNGPIIVGVKRGNEQSAIEAFRFGATDYITKPIREAEMMSVVQRALADVRLRKERNDLMVQLTQSNQALEARLNQLTTLQKLGKTLTSMQSLDGMFDAVLLGALDVTAADHATLILLDENSNQLVLRAGKKMTLVMQEKLGEPINDELARMVMLSQEPLVVEGDSLKRFKIARDILATIYAPLIVHGKAIGVLTVGNHRKRSGFDQSLTAVVTALADYAAVAIVNARLFATLDKRAKAAYNDLQNREQQLNEGVLAPLKQAFDKLQESGKIAKLPDAAKTQIQQIQQQIEQIRQFIVKTRPNAAN